jgi:hypothetical protein
MNGGNEGKGIWLMDFINIYKIEQWNYFKWGRERVEAGRWWG